MKIFLCLVAASLSIAVYAQRLQGRVLNEKGQAVAGASVAVERISDSSLLRLLVADRDGHFDVTMPADTVQLLVTATGYVPRRLRYMGQPMDIVLKVASTELKAVVVTARRPLVEVKPDKLVLNVAGSINAAGSNALELLRKSPGVLVDNSNSIIMNGKNGVRLYIDGKQMPLGGAELADYLQTINASDVEAIEIISQPGSRYEAAGNAGIINIRLKKNQQYGWNGSANGGWALGIYPKYNAGASLNHRNKRINLFNTYSVGQNRNESFLNLNRLQADSNFDQRSTNIQSTVFHNLKTGIDIYLNKRSVLGLVTTANISHGRSRGNSVTPITATSSKVPDRILTSLGNSGSHRDNYTANINYRWADTSGHRFAADLDYGSYSSGYQNYVPNRYTDAAGQLLSFSAFGTRTPVLIQIGNLKVDYDTRWLKGQLSAGINLSLVNARNLFDFYHYDSNSKPVLDSFRSNYFSYDENINAAYASWQRKLGTKWELNAGLRMEHTKNRGKLQALQPAANAIVERDYFDWFPNLSVSYAADAKHSIAVSYSRRIDRPRYQDLNPFQSQIDELTYQQGNPFLRPQYTQSVELRHTYAYKLSTTLSYSKVTDMFAQITDTIDGNRNFIQQRNMARQQIVSLNISYPFIIASWWSVYANANVFHSRYRATYEQGKAIALNATTATLYQQHSFTFGKGWTGELSSYYNSPGVWGGTYETRSIWGLDAGLMKKFWQDNASIRVAVTDIFRTYPWRGVSQFGGLQIVASGGWESRQLQVNFQYRFGNKQAKTGSSRRSAIDELENRTN